MRLVVLGAAGRMGRTLIRAVLESDACRLAAAVGRPGAASLGADAGALVGLGAAGVVLGEDLEAACADADGLLDFSTPATSVAASVIAARAGLVHVIGTTGLSEADIAAIRLSAAAARIVQSGNTSLGVNLLAALVRRAAEALDPGWDIEIVEMHHRAKVDAPSGTALLLGEAAAEGRGITLADRSARGRDGHTGPRREGDIGFASLRGGSVVGEHTVVFAAAGERLELSHRADDRGLFARGAIQAALWARDRPAGFYAMSDVLGLG